MAIAPQTVYPGQIDTTDVGYPQGKAKNVLVVGDGTGTPFEKTWLNDVFGFQQALLGAASITPSGSPDKVGASQYLLAIRYLTENVIGFATFNGGLVATDLSTTGPFGVQGASDMVGAVHLFSTLLVDGIATFTGAPVFSTGFHSVGAGLIDAGLIVGGGFGVTSGSVTIGSGTSGNTIQQEVALSGAGRIRERVVYATDADAFFDCTQADVVAMRAGTPSATRNTKLATTGASLGSRIEIRNYDTVHTLNVQDSSPATIITLPVATLHGAYPAPSVARMQWADDGVSGARWVIAEYTPSA